MLAVNDIPDQGAVWHPVADYHGQEESRVQRRPARHCGHISAL